jgi:ADP-ribosyl-[dinitrogen reductase] hydrolase
MALNAVYRSHDFSSAITNCVNMLGDADSTGAVAGQIAGALYGFGDIPDKMKADLWRWDDGEIALRAALLLPR